MEGGGNMKREGEGHRETESERREEQSRAERVVLEFGIRWRKSEEAKGR